ncbi:dihydropteridine reductase [Exiguobacterium sp. TDN 0502]|uniref:dihydropteridine reductase n=1 Tax=Exiguobacterium sp. TDN 0502 TaxID=3420731 RepID=UPI003D775D64
MQIDWLPLEQVTQEGEHTYTFHLKRPDGFVWEEGAHTHMALEGFNAGEKPNRSLIRHMSISTLPHEGTIGITTRIKPECSVFKETLRQLRMGEKIALFKTHSNIPLRRENRTVYLLSAGVGLATFRPIILQHQADRSGIPHMHSLNIDSTRTGLFQEHLRPTEQFSTYYVDNRSAYFDFVKEMATDKEGLFYIVGSDDFLTDTIDVLKIANIPTAQMMLDKRQDQLNTFLT